MYTVQVGSFAREANARAMRTRVAQRYGDVTILGDRVGDRLVYRVLSGRFSTHTQAERRRASLQRAGFDTFVRRVSRSPIRAERAAPERTAWQIVADQVDAARFVLPPGTTVDP